MAGLQSSYRYGQSEGWSNKQYDLPYYQNRSNGGGSYYNNDNKYIGRYDKELNDLADTIFPEVVEEESTLDSILGWIGIIALAITVVLAIGYPLFGG